MEPITTTLLTALIAGAAAGATTVAGQAIKDAYTGLKQLVLNTFGATAPVAAAIQQVETKPDSEGRKLTLKEELETALPATAPAAQQALLTQAQTLLALLKEAGQQAATYNATNIGSGAIAQGPGAVAAGQGGIAVGGNVSNSPLITGSGNVIAHDISGNVATGSNARQINTGGGAYVEHDVNTGGGDFIGRDKNVHGIKPVQSKE